MCCTQEMLAWGGKGHDVVAYIAEQNLSCRARRQITRMLDGHSMVYYSSWMDNLRNDPNWEGGYDVTKTWHYANVDEGYTFQTMPRTKSGDVVSASEMFIDSLKSRTAPDSIKTLYLKLLIHTMGDMHCPMHAGRLSDRGGNGFVVKWFNKPTNLHSVWDSKIIESSHSWSYTEWQQQLDRSTRRERKQITRGTMEDWFSETVAMSDRLYNSAQVGQNLSFEYIYQNNWILEQQLLRGGYRLAAVLNDIFR